MIFHFDKLKFPALVGIFAFLVVLHVPLVDIEMRQNLLLLFTGLLCAIAAPEVLNFNKSSKIKKLAIILFVWLLFIYLHSIGYPPLTEYAQNKFQNLIFISTTTLLLIPFIVEKYKLWNWLIVILVTFAVVMAIVSFFPSQISQNARYSVIDLSPTMLGRIVVIPIIVFLFYVGHNTRTKVILAILSLIGLAACVNTGSRSPLLMVALAYFIFLALNARFSLILKSSLVLTVLGAIFMVYLNYANPEVASRFNLEDLSIAQHSDEGDRVYMWKLSLDLIASHWAGMGLGNFSAAFWLNAPHNIWLEAIVELGIIGSVPLFILSFIGLRDAVRLMKNQNSTGRFIGGFFMFAFLTSLIGNELTLTSIWFYMSLGLGYLYVPTLDQTSRSHVKKRTAKRFVLEQRPSQLKS